MSEYKLKPYQKIGVKWLLNQNGIGLIADDMGLGKSCQSLTYLKIMSNIRPVLIVCSASLKLNWQREIKIWTGEDSYIINGKKSTILPNYNFYIINYDILADEMKIHTKTFNKKGKEKIKKVLKDTSWIFKLGQMNIKAIIIDECQNISSEKAIKTKAIYTLRKTLKDSKFIPLSGTPIKNKPSEFFTILNLLDEKQFPNRWKFYHKYCGPKHNGFGWTFDGATNIEELNYKLQSVMIRRTKDEVLKELPPKQKIVIPMEADKLELNNYLNASKQFIEWIKTNTDNNEIKNNIDRLRQLAYIAKRNSVIKWIEEYLSTGNKLVIGAFHTNAINDIYEHFKKISVKIDGGITGKNRQDAVDSFQKNEKIKLIICQLLTVPGLTLTAASATCTIEFAWSPSDHVQFEDRVHRIGQESDSVFAYYLILPNSVDEECMAIVNNKYSIVNKVLDNKDNTDIFEDSFLKVLLKKYSKRIL